MFADLPAPMLQILGSCRTLPSAPAVVMQVLDLSQDPDIGTAKVAKVLSRDPALVAKILKVANSAWCGIQREVTTLEQAVSLLGLNGTMSLALSFSLVRRLRAAEGRKFDHQTYWRRSAISATATLSVGASIRAGSRDELFLAGLLQDIGMLVLNEAMPSYGLLVSSAKLNHAALVEIEHKDLHTDHAQVGSWFLKRWHLPNRLIAAISASHEHEGIEEPLARSVAIGSRIAEFWINPDIVAATTFFSNAVESMLGLSPEQLDPVLRKTAAELPEVTENLDISIGDDVLINKLLDQAREAIAELNLRTLQENRKIAIQSQRDALTSLHNRAYLNQVLEDQFNQCQKLGQPLTVIFIDIDKFKNINDTYGHHGGDAILVSVSQVIQSAVRNYDTVVRFGGDEFVVLLVNAREDIAAEIAERIRSMVSEKLHNAGEGNFIHVTISAGWTTMSPGSYFTSAKDLLKAADNSLYAAKTAGRNRVAQAS
jgi:diguanylate cyclase (GGDEF)-like protein